LSFDIKGLPGFSVDFHMDASGKVTEAVFNQPNGVFHAKRKYGQPANCHSERSEESLFAVGVFYGQPLPTIKKRQRT